MILEILKGGAVLIEQLVKLDICNKNAKKK